MKGFLVWLKQTTTQIQVLGLFITGTTESLSNFAKIQTAILKGDWDTAGKLFSENAEIGADYYEQAIALIKEADAYDPQIMPSDWKMPENPFGDWLDTVDDTVDDAFEKMLERLKKAAAKIQEYATSFRDSIDFALGLNQTGTRFSAERFVRQLQRAVDAAKKLPGLLNQIYAGKTTGSTAIISQLKTMDPVQATTIAEGLLSSGQLQNIGSLRNQLSVAGMQTATAGTAYTININKANVSPTEIVNLIKAYERSTGKKVLLG